LGKAFHRASLRFCDLIKLPFKFVITFLFMASASLLGAQTIQTLCSFNGADGAYPGAGLTQGNDGNFYGTTAGGGGITNSAYPNGMGTVFRVTTNGALTTLAVFDFTNGAWPEAALTLGTDGNFYGTTQDGGATGYGNVFKVTTSGMLTTLVSFNYTNGAQPNAGLTLGNDGSFYGTTAGGGITSVGYNGWGTVFQVTTNGTLTTLAFFDFTNGAWPEAALRLGTDGNFYGTTGDGGITNSTYPDGMGTVFRVTTNGVLTTVASFDFTNGACPYDALTLGNDDNFYGTTHDGGSSNCGTVFRLLIPPVSAYLQNQTALIGSSVTLNATVYGSPPFVYQWFFNGLPIAIATNGSLTISNFNLLEAGAYSVTVSNQDGCGTAVSVVRLTNSPVVLVDGVDVGGGTVSLVASAPQISMSSSFGSSTPIYYTLDGSTPSFLSVPYSGPFQLTGSATIRALAYDPDYLSSAEAAPITVVIVPTYEIKSSTPGEGSISVSPTPYSGGDCFISNTVVTIAATPSNGWSFLGWLGDVGGTNPVATLTMTRDMAAQAIFGTAITSNALGDGQIWFEGQVTVCPYGTTLAVAAVPQTGSYLMKWAGSLSGSNNPNVLVVTNPNPIITALFGSLSTVQYQYALTVLPQGAGSVTVSPYTNTYSSGDVVTVTAIPNSEQTFTRWSGDASGSQNPLTLTMTQSMVITANFTSRATLSTIPPYPMVEQGFRFSLTGELGFAYRIDGSADLSNWVPVGWVTNDLGTAQFLDRAAPTNATQVYRAVTQ
jgi:uncharacterized repeat protein (TIGR03803 family)